MNIHLFSFDKIHGNPGDYAWGRGGLDAIITQVAIYLTELNLSY